MKMQKVLLLMFALILGYGAIFSGLHARQVDTTKIHSAIMNPGEIREGILVYEDPSGDWYIWSDHRLYWDAAVYMGDNPNKENLPMTNGAMLRRGIIQFKATMYRDWEAYIDLNASQGDALTPRDMWVARHFRGDFHNFYIQAGNFKEATGIERLTSSRLITFMERGGDGIFEDGRRKGLALTYFNPHIWAQVGTWGQEIDQRRFTQDNEAWGFNGRVAYTPIRQDRRIVHIGAWASVRPPDADNNSRVRLRGRPESRIASNDSQRFLNTGQISDVNNYTRYGLELGTVLGPLQVQGEYKTFNVNRKNDLPNPSFWSGYVKASYFLTGESRGYFAEEGEFGNFDHPRNSWGAVQLALRYSRTNLNHENAGIMGGDQEIITLGLNYFATRYIRFYFNYAFVRSDENANGAGSLIPFNYTYFQTRMMVRLP